MLRVTVELLPGGSPRDREDIAILEVWNVGGTELVGDYAAKLWTPQSEVTREVLGFDRRRGALELVREALERTKTCHDS